MSIPVFGLIVPLLILSSAGGASGTGTSFRGLGQPPVAGETRAKAISGDGRVVVVWIEDCEPGEFPVTVRCDVLGGYRWTEAEGFQELDGGLPEDVSGDGSVVAGWGPPPAHRWTAAGWTDVTGGLGDVLTAKGISGLGDTLVGSWREDLDELIFYEQYPARWSSTTGLELLDALVEGEARSVSADGSVAAGFTGPNLGVKHAARWVPGQLTLDLGTLVPWIPEARSEAYAVSPDGGTVVGFSSSLDGPQAFRWVPSEGMVGLGLLDGAWTVATSVSQGGEVIVGFASDGIDPLGAFIWDATRGMRRLDDVLASEQGLPITGWTLLEAVDVSFEGTTIVGNGVNPSGQSEAWIAVVPEPSAAASGAVGVAVVALLGVRNRRRRAGATPWERLRRGDRPPQSRFSWPAR